jgi:hypothetical protein
MACAAFLGACLETETVLGAFEQASIDARLVANGREYYVEQRAAGVETVRYGGRITAVKGASFLHVCALSDDARLSKADARWCVRPPARGT